MGKKRLFKEKAENMTPGIDYYVQPIDDSMLTWHFTVLGVEGTCYEGGMYHGYFKLPTNYPLKAPGVYFTTPNGRFGVNQSICLTMSEHHNELWTPAWSLRTMTQAVANYMMTDEGKPSKQTLDKRKQMAIDSNKGICSHCGPISEIAKMIIRNRNPQDNKQKNGSNTHKLDKVTKTALNEPASIKQIYMLPVKKNISYSNGSSIKTYTTKRF